MSSSAYKNAFKHGLYARRLSKEEVESIGAIPVLNIEGEIGYQRALIGRMGEILENNGLAAGSRQGLTEETRQTMRLLNETMTKLLAYLRVHNMLKGDLSEYREEIERGKMLGRERRHVFDYFKPREAIQGREAAEGAPARKQDRGESQKSTKKKSEPRSKRAGNPTAKKSDSRD